MLYCVFWYRKKYFKTNKKKNYKSFLLVNNFNSAVTVETVLFFLLGICGYLSLLNDTPEIIINREKLPGSKDVAIIIGKTIYLFNLIFNIPLNFCGARNEVSNMIYKVFNLY